MCDSLDTSVANDLFHWRPNYNLDAITYRGISINFHITSLCCGCWPLESNLVKTFFKNLFSFRPVSACKMLCSSVKNERPQRRTPNWAKDGVLIVWSCCRIQKINRAWLGFIYSGQFFYIYVDAETATLNFWLH